MEEETVLWGILFSKTFSKASKKKKKKRKVFYKENSVNTYWMPTAPVIVECIGNTKVTWIKSLSSRSCHRVLK